MSDTRNYISVEEYFNSQSQETREALLQLRDCIYEAAPDAIELINYNIPAYALIEGGKRDQQIMIAGYKNHVGLYPYPKVIEKFENELSVYKKAKGSVQFPIDKPLPKKLIVEMVRYRIESIS